MIVATRAIVVVRETVPEEDAVSGTFIMRKTRSDLKLLRASTLDHAAIAVRLRLRILSLLNGLTPPEVPSPSKRRVRWLRPRYITLDGHNLARG